MKLRTPGMDWKNIVLHFLLVMVGGGLMAWSQTAPGKVFGCAVRERDAVIFLSRTARAAADHPRRRS